MSTSNHNLESMSLCSKIDDIDTGNRTASSPIKIDSPPSTTTVQAPSPITNVKITHAETWTLAAPLHPHFTPTHDTNSTTNGGISSSRHNPDFLDRTHARRLEIEDKLSALRRRLFDVTRGEDEGGLEELYRVLVKEVVVGGRVREEGSMVAA